MRYVSTRGQSAPVSGAEAIIQGLCPDGGLYIPEEMPRLPKDFVRTLAPLDYPDRAAAVLRLFLPEFRDLESLCREAYSRFHGQYAPLCQYESSLVLELWHGPTCAFKDMALQMLPVLMTAACELTGETREICILTATSGDTGKAALEGFRDRPGTRVIVFYPQEGVSDIQKLQMTTQEGDNTAVCGVVGNFDDAQSGVKQVFSHPENAGLPDGMILSSANSINLGRLLPQVAYYVSAYVDFAALPEHKDGQPLNICVPTGNFGNILAALYAREMGVPIGRLLCASNRNHVLTDLIQTGVYDRNRALYPTDSPSMDILISSNWERALYLFSGGDASYVRSCMEHLSREGRYTLRDDCEKAMQSVLDGYWCDDDRTKRAIGEIYERTGQVIDPHTAVGMAALLDREGFDQAQTPYMTVATAHPGKFPEAVLAGLVAALSNGEPKDLVSALDKYIKVPAQLKSLFEKPVRFTEIIEKEDISGAVARFVNPSRM